MMKKITKWDIKNTHKKRIFSQNLRGGGRRPPHRRCIVKNSRHSLPSGPPQKKVRQGLSEGNSLLKARFLRQNPGGSARFSWENAWNKKRRWFEKVKAEGFGNLGKKKERKPALFFSSLRKKFTYFFFLVAFFVAFLATFFVAFFVHFLQTFFVAFFVAFFFATMESSYLC